MKTEYTVGQRVKVTPKEIGGTVIRFGTILETNVHRSRARYVRHRVEIDKVPGLCLAQWVYAFKEVEMEPI